MGKYPPELLKGMAMRCIQARNSSDAPKAFAVYATIAGITGWPMNRVVQEIHNIANSNVDISA